MLKVGVSMLIQRLCIFISETQEKLKHENIVKVEHFQSDININE